MTKFAEPLTREDQAEATAKAWMEVMAERGPPPAREPNE